MANRCLLFLALTAGALAGPLTYRESPSSCASTCPESSKFSWQTGKTYEYQYESDVKTHIAGATEEHSSLHIRATALIEVLAPCEMALRLSDVSLQDSSPSQYESRQHVEQSWEFKKALQERPLRFAFLDGRIESVCPEQGDETWVINLKKGIISAFQNTQTRLDASTTTVESDVAGTCPVEYTVEGSSWGTKTIKKTKDLLGCTERMGHFTAFQSTPYNVESAIQSMPLMKSTHECRQQIKNGIMTESSCSELHVFRPFSRGNNGAVTEVSYKLSLYKENTGVSTSQRAVRVKSSLLFEHEPNTDEMVATSREAQQSLEKLCRKSRDEISTEVPRLFRELVHQMRRLDTRTLQNFYRSAANTCDKAPKFLRDAIPVLGTSASVMLIRDIVIAEQISDSEAKIWLTSMAFIGSPTKEMLAQVKTLLTTNHNLRKSILAISTMVHTYCRQNVNCNAEREVNDIIRILEENLHYNCRVQSDEQHDLILMSLKGISNIGRATQTESTINRCFRNQELSTEIRVAALQALRRMSCNIAMTNVQELLGNSLEDSELRIHAYLTLMQCPQRDTLNYVREILNNEEVNQVGSFIWTHLTNLMETANPHKRDIRAILENAVLQKKFDLDKRKFSRNIEWSAFSQLINVGGVAEGNLIWSEKSFVPRSASLNLTVEMFGESVNLLEIGARVQGLEKMLEKLFADQDNTVERRKRSTDEIDTIDRRYGLKRDSTQASYYIRVFGNEIRYDDFHNFDLDTIKDKLNYLDWLIELSKEHKFEMTKSMLFLDADMIIPTAAGLPLKLTVDGTSSVSVSVSGKLDIRQMFSSLSTFDIDGTVKPSASLEVNGEMGVDAHVARTGMKMKTTLHTSTMAQGKIQMQDGRIFNLDIKPPQDNTQVISAEKKFFIIYRNEEREQQMLSANRYEKKACTSPKFGTITGIELCGELSLPSPEDKNNVPWFIFWGPASAKVVLNKKDAHDNYLMEVKYIKEKIRENGVMGIKDIARIYMDTPGSRVNRKLLVDLTVDRNGKQVDFNLDTPWKKATLQGGLTNTDEMKRFFTTVTLDGRDQYMINAEVAIDKHSYSSQYTPKLEIRIPGRERILLNGDVKYRPGKKGVFTMALKNVFEEPVKVSGSIIAINDPNQMRYETDLDFSSHLLSGKVSAFVDNTKDEKNAVSSKLDIEYTYKNQPRQSIKFEQQFLGRSRSDTYSYTLDSSWSTTLIPRYNGDVHFQYSMDKESLNMNINAGFDDNRRITYSEMVTFKFGREMKFDLNTQLQFPYKNIDYSGTFGYLFNEDGLQARGSLKYGAGNNGNFEIMARRNSRKPLNVVTTAKLTYPGRDMSLSGRVEERGANVYYQYLTIQLQKYDDIQINSVYKMKARHELTTDVIIPDVPKITIKGHLKPELKDLQAGGEVNYNGKVYLTDVYWVHRGNYQDFNTQANLEVAYPGRQITAQGSASRRDNEITSSVETKWDAKNDENKKFVMSSKVNIEPSTPAVSLQISVYPRHFINLNANGKYETKGWYKSDSDVEGSFSLQSSFENFEDIKASFRHDRTPKVYKNSADFSWATNQKITGEVNLKKKQGSWANCEINALITTPFRGVRQMNTELSYNLDETAFSTNAKVKLEDKQVTLGFNGELNVPQHKLSGEISFTSPFRDFEAITASLRHNDDGQRYQSNAAISWAPSKQINAAFNMQHQGNAAAAINNGKLLVSTPFHGFQQMKASWKHEHSDVKLINTAEIENEGKSIYMHNAVANVRKTNRVYTADVQASLKARNMEEISFTIDHRHDRQNMQTMRSDYSLSWKPSKTITLFYDLDMSGNNLLLAKVKFMSPFKGFESLVMNSNTMKKDQTYTSSNEFKWATNKKLTLDSRVTVSGYNLQLTGSMTTPFDGARNVVVNARNQQQDGIWVTHVDLDYGKRIELDTELSTGWKKMINVHLQSACPYVHNFRAKAEMKGVSRNFQYNVEVNHEKLASPITWTGVVKTSDLNKIKITSDLTTPFSNIRSLKIAMNHVKEGDSIHIDGLIQHPSYKATITEDIAYSVNRFVNAKTVVEYMEGKKVELDFDVKIKPKVSVKASWKSPFEKFENIDLILNHEGTLKSFSTAGELSYSPRDKIAGTANFDLRGNVLSTKVMLSTPFREAKRVVININHEGPLTGFKNGASFELNRKRVSAKSDFNLNGNNMNLKAELLTPIEGYETATLELTHQGPITNFDNNAMLTVGNQQLSGSSEMRLRRSSFSGRLGLQMPFRKLSRVNLNIDHTGSWSDFNNKVVIAYNNKKILSKTTFVLSGTNIDGKITVKTPFTEVRSMGLEIKHEGPATDFKNSAIFTLNEKDVTAISEFTLTGNNLALKVSVSSPFSEIKTLNLELVHQGPANNFNNNGVLIYNDKQVTASSQFRLRGSAVNGKASFTMPEHTLAGEFSHRGEITNFNNNALFTYNEKRIGFDSQLKLIDNNLVSKANFASPWATMSGEINHDGPLHGFRNNAILKYNNKQATAGSEFSLNGNVLSGKGNLNVPNHRITVDINHSGPVNNFNNYVAVTYNGEMYRGESQFSKSGNRISGKIQCSCPFRTSSAEFNHRGKITNFNNDMTLIYGDKKIEGNSKFKLNGNAMTAEGSLETPQKSMSIVASHEGPIDNFKNSFNFQYNRKRIRGSSELSLSGSNLALKASLNTPYRTMKSASIDLSHNGPLSNFNNNVLLNVNNKQITANSQFSLSGNRVNAKAALQGPEISFDGELNHNGKLANFKNDARLSYNGQQLTGNSEFRWRQNNVNLKGNLQTPSSTLSVDLMHSGTWRNFNNNGLATFNNRRVSGSSSFNMNGHDLTGKATLLAASNKFELELNHRGPVNNFVSDARAEFNGKEVSGNVQFELNGNNLEGKAQLKLPVSELKIIGLEVYHHGPATNFETLTTITIGDNNINSRTSFSLQGNTLTAKGTVQTTYDENPVSLELYHSGPETSFTNNAVLSYGNKQLSGSSEFSLQGNDLKLKANLQTTFCSMKPVSIEVTHTGPAVNFACRATAKYGSHEISLNNDFSLRGNSLHLKSSMMTNIGTIKPVSVEVNHEGPMTDFNNNALISYGDDNIGGSSEFKLQGNMLHLKVTGQTSFGNVKPVSIEINHNGPIDKFDNTIEMSYGNKEISSELNFAIDGNTITSNIKLQTPYKPIGKIVAKFNHNGKNWRNFENTGTLKVNNKKYTGQSELRWFGKIFKMYAEINVPDEYSIKINHKGIKTDFSNNMKIKIPGEKISGTSSFKMNENKMEGRASLDSTMRSLNGFDAAFTHEGDGRKFKSSFDLQTPFRGYKSFSGELNHEGTMNNFRTTGTLNLPFQEVRNIAVTANHQTGDDSFNTAASVSYDNKAISGAVNYKKTDRKLTTDANIQTPYSRYENLAASVEHSGTGNNFQTKGTITTSIPGYERFSGMLSHRGDMNQFNTIAEVTTPIRRYNKFGVNVEHTGNRRNFKTSGSLTTSIPNYDRFAGDVEYSYDGTNLHAVGNVHTPFARYDDFGMKLDHTGSYNGFRTSVEATSSIPGYDKFGATVEKKGTLKDFEVSSDIRTPFRNYQHFGTGIKYSGEPMNFRTSGHVTTSVPGYEKVSGSLSHNGNLKAFTSNAEIKTPFPGHEVYTMAIDHNYNSGISTSASLEYPGKKYAFNLNHQGTANNFNSNLDIQTPHPGYEQFGLSVVHSGDLKDMTQSGTIRLPFRKIPEIKYTISHRGNLRDFTSSATVEYNREKIEGEWNYKHTSSWGEENYEGGATITSTHNQLRDFRLTAKHTRKSREKSGMLDIIYNNQQTVDMDYEYTTSGDKIINIKIRQPQPFETRINFHSDGKQINGDAYLSWNTMFTAKGELNMKNLANDREIDLKLVLPSRTISLKSDYKLSDSALAHSTDLQWGNEATKKLSYTLEASKTSRRGQTIIDGRFSIQSSQINGEATLSHISIPGRQCTTEVAVQTSKRMAIKSDLTIDSSRFQHTLTIEHPEIRRAASITTEGSVNGDSYDGKIELQYNREVLTLAGKLTDESTSTMQKLAAGFKVAHPRSGLDLQLSTDLENNDEMTTVYAEAKYLMATDRQYKISSLRAEINKLRKELNIEIVSPIDTFHVAGRLVSSSNGVSQYSGEAKCDHNEMRGELSVVSGKSVDLKIHYNHNDFLQATAKASPEQVKAEVFRMVSGDKIQEVLLMLQKDDERLVSGRTYWRPAIYREIKAAVEDNRFERQHKASWNRFVDEVKEEYSLRADYLKKNAKPFYKALVSIQKDIVSTFKDVKSELISMYNNNEFHLRDIRNYMLQVKEWSGSAYTTMKKSATDNYTKAKAVLIRSRRSLDEITDQAWNYTQELAKRLSDWWQNQDWSDIKEKIQDNARDIADQFSNHPTIRRFITKVEAYMQGDAVATSGSAPSLWDKLMSRDDVQTGISYIKKRVTDSDVANKYFEVKKTIDGIMEDVHKNGLKAVRANLVAWLKNYLRTDKDSFTVGDGDLEFSLYVPLPLDDLRSMPKVDINFSKYLRQARDLVNSYMPKYDWTYWDYYYYYKPSSNIRDLIPPFKGHATISGNQHYMTFDKRFYEFSGDCSYLLARDFIDGTFSVIVNYERTAGRPVRKSITVMSNDKKIVISIDGSVMMDNARVEMPVEMAGITILRDENQITVNNKNGVKITCDLAHDQCSVDVSGWYYSKTGGLLGTYNNEQVDDFTSVDRERLQNVGQFAASWSVGTRCRPTNSAIDVSNEVAPESRRYDICAKYFKYESSPFRRCFKVVDPKPFMKMCLNSMPTNVNHMETDEDTCNTAAFYVKECQRVEVPIRIPGLCVRCAMENGQIFSEGQNVTIKDEEVPSSADVVFIIHHHECNKMMLDNLKNIVDNLEKVFKLEQITNNRYAILGYGGPGIRGPVHIHTMDGQVFATRDKILLGLENFHTTSGEIEDAMAAVKYATNLPFRVGVSKNIVLLPCAPCRQGQATFSELQQLLLFRDINFHVLMQYNFLFKGNKNAGTAYIFGVDRETVYTRKDAGTTELVGDSEIRSHILMPKDLCVALSEETDGSVFNTLQYINSRPFIQKRFMDVLVRVIADKAEPSECQICDCRPDNVGAGKADCRHCVRPDPIYDIMPRFDSILLPPPAFETPEAPGLKPNVPKSVKTPKKAKKSKAKKSKKQLNAKKRAMRERRLRRLEQQQS